MILLQLLKRNEEQRLGYGLDDADEIKVFNCSHSSQVHLADVTILRHRHS